jgi:hypothetical protein
MPASREPNHSSSPSRAKLAFTVFAIVGAFFLIVEHRAHLIPFLPWLLLAACPLMHMFMHGGHGAHKSHGKGRNDPNARGPEDYRGGSPAAEGDGHQHHGDRP